MNATRDLGRMVMSASLAAIATSAGAATNYSFANGVTLTVGSIPAGAALPKITAPATSLHFTGVGANVTGFNDLLDVPCAAAQGACTLTAPNPKVSATTIRAPFNMPFATQFDALSYYNDTPGHCVQTNLTTMGVSAANLAGTLAFFTNYLSTPIYGTSNCTGASTSIAALFGSTANCASPTSFAGACFLDGIADRNLDWVQIFMASPTDYTVQDGGGADLSGNLSTEANFAAFKAAQLVFQGRYGNHPKAPRWIELFNEPEGIWNTKVSPSRMMQMITDFKSSLASLITIRQGQSPSTAEQAYLTALGNAQVVTPGLASAFEVDYAADSANPAYNGGAAWATGISWFPGSSDVSTFFSGVASNGLLLSTHTYDDKHTQDAAAVNVMSGLQSLFRVRNANSNNAALLLTEVAESVEQDTDTVGYMNYCGTQTLGADGDTCGAPRVGDGDAYAYPNCVSGATFHGTPFASADPSIAGFCHHQAAKLVRVIAEMANQADRGATENGVFGEMIWSLTPSKSSEHGLISRSGLATLMNAGTEPMLASFAQDGWSTIYPATGLETDLDSAAVFMAGAGAHPTKGRIVIANSSGTTKQYGLKLGTTQFAHYTQVTFASTIGGPPGNYTGTAATAANPVAASSGSNFGTAGDALVVTLPANSVVTLDLQ